MTLKVPTCDADNFVVVCVFYFLTFSKKYDIIYTEKMRKERKNNYVPYYQTQHRTLEVQPHF